MFNCNICCKVYVWPHDLQRHIRSKHSSDEPLYHPGVTQQQQKQQQQQQKKKQQQQKQQQKAFVCILLEGTSFSGNLKRQRGHLSWYFLVDLKARTPEASRLHTEVLQVGQGETPDGQRDDDRLSNTFEDDSSVSSDEDIADETTHIVRQRMLKHGKISSPVRIAEYLVFAHLRGLEAQRQQGCGNKNGIALNDDRERCRGCFEWIARDRLLCRRLA
ncbi:Hypothetical predicted protein [Mytilus galloprovincialis]|uniref:C2H2-type domain-containing protein n=1 Tax=Mytilus galloprovincialis TaxID=29158 RepID=A0A8B6FSD3_MYTGA|nr:Hypothetical predicted protein [Mytilus galloprovincialis]